MDENFGEHLRREREVRNIALQDVSRTTKIPLRSLEKLEAGEYEALPGEVFVRGFIKSYARCVGLDDESALLLYDSEREKRRAEAEESQPRMGQAEESPDTDPLQMRRRVGIAVFVVIVLIIATITLSLLLRRPHHTDGGLSLADPSAEGNEHVVGQRLG
ncbi:MAG: helix-turn-helix domain-containing protein [Deltaproteobacteria bacterium]|nr:helix-turn-helix domain-containing protein [Deltaproteobacteria bacterium]